MYKKLLLVFLMALPAALYAQSNGTRADIVNKKWRIVAMKCPEQHSDANDEDQFVHYYSSLKLTPANNYTSNDYGSYVKVHKDVRDNPKETGTYKFTTAQDGATLLALKPKKGMACEYRVELVHGTYLTLINMAQDEKCKVSYAIAP